MRLRCARFVTRLDRYVLRQIAVPFVLSVAVVVVLVFLLQARRLASAALGLGLTLEDVFVIFTSALPPFLVLAVPIAYLLSVLIGLGRLAQDLELIAFRAAGASGLRIARVPIILGLVVTGLGLPLAHFAEPYGLQALQARLIDVGLRNLTQAVRPGTFNEDFSGNAVYARAKSNDGALIDVLVFDERDPQHPVLVTSAKGGFRVTDRSVEFELSQGELHMGDPQAGKQYERIRFDALRMELDAKNELRRKTRFVSAISMLDSREIMRVAKSKGPNDAFGRRFEKTFWRRFSVPLMALVFGLLGSAIALSASPRSRARNALMGLGSVLGYYILSRVGDLMVVKYPGTPFWGAFGPVLLMFVLSLIALYRAEARQ
jgi:lipopolysaccharide export system permease protein